MPRSWKDVRAEVIETAGLDEERLSALEAELRDEERAHRLAETRPGHDIGRQPLRRTP